MLLAGESGVTPIDRFEASKFPTWFGGQIRTFHAEGYIDGKSDRRLDDCLRYCIVARKKALERADLGGERLDKVNWRSPVLDSVSVLGNCGFNWAFSGSILLGCVSSGCGDRRNPIQMQLKAEEEGDSGGGRAAAKKQAPKD
ncbi:hypothetical protein SASPL_135814 [Salvia splendens]|uniref:beta-ketoacyl-[acyl-carrier-protein] synthase I n=1 Tax=Salvia splendens TaxID=180675 RepID=A0A8X8ZGB5_SALSN|nr:hypothetical protein SASPL_135814 [Salvia splendens]